jgi:hypothetical protein
VADVSNTQGGICKSTRKDTIMSTVNVTVDDFESTIVDNPIVVVDF